MGAYHGMLVKHGRETFVLCGPATAFLPGSPSTTSDDSLVPSRHSLTCFDFSQPERILHLGQSMECHCSS